MKEIRLMQPGRNGQVINEYGLPEFPPANWAFLPAGDAAITRKVTATGACWRVQVKKGRRMQSVGIWAPKETIEKARQAVLLMRTAPDYEKRREAAAKSRNKKQEAYIIEFQSAISDYLSFHECYKTQETEMTRLVTEHAIPVGSGTVARTQMIPVDQRAAKAVIAWMRHRTTGYDNMKIPKIKGKRRAIRRTLADSSVQILKRYRSGAPVSQGCPLWKALSLNKG